ncbi:hypothetical protein PITCH_A80046 [uncultured Desulfobacterium sp.]|uniref:Uncharacterized protein n=1 Tax=uncultured Desulfobacterium sp. TaxID=201089 RepID=A0A445N2X6_9BACT|nr:hypothetical protein PITCH_A80046 [uncultured Desulfobacterium sp.]
MIRTGKLIWNQGALNHRTALSYKISTRGAKNPNSFGGKEVICMILKLWCFTASRMDVIEGRSSVS